MPIASQPQIFAGRFANALIGFFCLAGFSAPVLAQDIGTLFTSPEERQYLDFLRDELVRESQLSTFNIQEDVIPEIPVVEEEPETAGPVITVYRFGGILERRNGNRFVWLNGRQVAETDLPANIAIIDTPGGTQLRIRADDTSYFVKPGQTINVRTGSVEDAAPAAEPQAGTPAPDNAAAGAQTAADAPGDEAGIAVNAAPPGTAGDTGADDPRSVLELLELSGEELDPEQLTALENALRAAEADNTP